MQDLLGITGLRKFDVGESEMVLDLVGSQTAYRVLASKLRAKYGTMVLRPIDEIVKKNQPPAATFGIEKIEEMKKGSATSKQAVWWCVDDVQGAMLAKLAELGKHVKHGGRFVPRLDRGENVVWPLFGGDKGGDLFKFGLLFANVENPQNPLEILWLSSVRGVGDSYENLKRTALRPAFAKQVNGTAHVDLVRVFSALHVESQVESEVCVETGLTFVPKGLPMSDTGLISLAKTPEMVDCMEYDVSSGAYGVLAVYGGRYVGVAHVREFTVTGGVSFDGGGHPVLEALSKRAKDPVVMGIVHEFLLGVGDAAPPRQYVGLVGFSAFNEAIACGAFVCVEVLGMRRMFAADHALYACVRGHLGAAAMMPCYGCDILKASADRLGNPRAVAELHACAERCPLAAPENANVARQRIMQRASWKTCLPAYKSISAPPLLDFEYDELSFGAVHCMLGETQRLHDRTVVALAPLDQTSTDGLARAARHLELTGDVAKLEASVPHLETDFEKLTGKLEDRRKSLEAKRELQTSARARIDKAQAKRGASAASLEAMAKVDALVERYAGEVKELESDVKAATAALKRVKKEIDDLKKDTQSLADADGSFIGPLVKGYISIIEQLRVVVQAWYQKFVGNHCRILQKERGQIWDHLASVVDSQPGLSSRRAEFDKIRVDLEALAGSLDTIFRLLLTVPSSHDGDGRYVPGGDLLTDSQIGELKQAVDAYLPAVKKLDPVIDDEKEADVPLKRHALLHLLKLAIERRRVGPFSESAFESIHHHINCIQRRCCHIRELIQQEKSIRLQWHIRTSSDGRKAREAHRLATARGPRKS